MLSNLIISLPDLSKQESLVEHLDSIRLKVSQLDDVSQQKLTALKCLKQSILQKAFTGELTRDFVSEELAA
jgi:type I restriction enzyme S subunit